MNPEFLSEQDVLDIHALQMARFGGSSGVRDHGLLASAVAQPQAAFDGSFLHPDLFEMAAAYLFHLTSNHPFVDGNKRIGLAAALVFLDINGLGIRNGTEELYSLTMAVAQGQLQKPAIAAQFRALHERDM